MSKPKRKCDPWYMTDAERKAHGTVARTIVAERYAGEPVRYSHYCVHDDGSVSVTLSITLSAEEVCERAERDAKAAKGGGK
jgi:hypothetical protein